MVLTGNCILNYNDQLVYPVAYLLLIASVWKTKLYNEFLCMVVRNRLLTVNEWLPVSFYWRLMIK